MSSILKKLKVSQETQGEILEDRVGSFQALESDIYTGEIKVAYLGESKSGSAFLHIELDIPKTDTFRGGTYRENIYISNRNGETFWVDKDSQEKRSMKGFNIANAIAALITGEGLMEQDFEERVFKLRNFETGKDEDTTVDCPVNLLGQEISLGIVKAIVNKNEKGDDNKYYPTSEKREENSIEAVFNTEYKCTIAEFYAADGDPEKVESKHWDVWLKANKDKVIDKFKEPKKGGGLKKTVGKTSSSSSSASEPKKTLGMFGKK